MANIKTVKTTIVVTDTGDMDGITPEYTEEYRQGVVELVRSESPGGSHIDVSVEIIDEEDV